MPSRAERSPLDESWRAPKRRPPNAPARETLSARARCTTARGRPGRADPSLVDVSRNRLFGQVDLLPHGSGAGQLQLRCQHDRARHERGGCAAFLTVVVVVTLVLVIAPALVVSAVGHEVPVLAPGARGV